MKYKFFICILFATIAPLAAAPADLEAALTAKDHDRVLELYKAGNYDEADVERLATFFAGEKEKYRKKFSRAIREKSTPSVEAGKHVHAELLRLIKGNLVEDDVDYTVLLLEAAAISKNQDLIYVVAPFLVHPQSRLRAEANKVVAQKRDERIYPLIGQLLAGDNAIDKVYAMETLLALKDERAVPLLLLQLSNVNKNVRYFALKTLDAIKSDKAQYGIINAAQGDKDEEVRLKAIEILRHFRTGPVFSALQKLISDPIYAARQKALESAIDTHNKQYANAISDQLARETEHAHKHALLKSLLDLGSGGGMNGVLTLLRRENDPELLLWSVVACNRFGETRCADALVALISATKDTPILIECIVALGSLKQRKHLGMLLSVAQAEAQPQIIRSAALAAVQQYDTEAVILPLFDAYSKEHDQAIRVQMRQMLVDLMRRKLPKI
ncbi:MAG: HEAT repeat domain-containing protein [Turneriella sp.]